MVGPGVVQLSAGQHVDGASTDFEGVVGVAENGCKLIRVTAPTGDTSERWAIWPDGAQLVPEVDGVQIDDQTYVDGDRVFGSGRLVDLSALPDGLTPGSYFGSYGGFCDAQSRGVVVIDAIQRA